MKEVEQLSREISQLSQDVADLKIRVEQYKNNLVAHAGTLWTVTVSFMGKTTTYQFIERERCKPYGGTENGIHISGTLLTDISPQRTVGMGVTIYYPPRVKFITAKCSPSSDKNPYQE